MDGPDERLRPIAASSVTTSKTSFWSAVHVVAAKERFVAYSLSDAPFVGQVAFLKCPQAPRRAPQSEYRRSIDRVTPLSPTLTQSNMLAQQK